MTTLTHPVDTPALLASLAGPQQRVLGILAGLDEHRLRQPVLPSGWSCLGMVQHLTEMTTFWFIEVMTGRRRTDQPTDDFAVSPNRSATEVLDSYRTAVELGTRAVEALPVSAPPAWWPEGLWGDWRLDDLAEVVLHVLVETSCHAGHLDAARELIDGRTWNYAENRLS